MRHPMQRAVLFDLDDTLTDRAESIGEYARRLCADFAAELETIAPESVQSFIHGVDNRGYAPRELVCANLRANLPWRTSAAPDVSRLAAHWETAFPRSTIGRVGFAEVMAALRARGFLLGIVTNGGIAMQELKLERLGIRDLLSSWIVSKAVGVAKPDAKIFYLATDELGCPPEHVYYVGDHPQNDILGAAAAGLEPIWLSGVHPWPAETPFPRHRIETLHDVLAIVGG